MDGVTTVNSTFWIILVVLIVFFIVFIIITYLYWGSTGGYVSLFVLFILILLAVILVYFSIFSGTGSPTFQPITPSPLPPQPIPVKYGDTVSLTSGGLSIVPCSQTSTGYLLTSSSSPQKIWSIQGGNPGQPVSYGDLIYFTNTLSGFPQTNMVGKEIDFNNNIWNISIPSTQQDLFLHFFINKAIGNHSTSTAVMYTDIITLTYVDQLSGANLLVYVNLGTSNTPCGKSIQMIPSSQAPITSRWTIS